MHYTYFEKPSLETMKHTLSARLSLAEQLIRNDLDNGVISIGDTASFDNLHKATDPNCYISDDGEPVTSMEREYLCSYGSEDWIEYWQTLIEVMDAWLKGGMVGNIIDHLDDGILIERF